MCLKQGYFWTQCKRRAFPEESSLEVLTSPAPFPSIKKKSRACSFEGCFLSSLLHPPLISSSAFVAGLLPPAERAGCKPGARSNSTPARAPRRIPRQPGPPPAASVLPRPSPGPSPQGHLEPLPGERAWEIKSTPNTAQVYCMATGSGGAGTASPGEDLVGMEVSVQGTKRRRVGGVEMALFLLLLGFFGFLLFFRQ